MLPKRAIALAAVLAVVLTACATGNGGADAGALPASDHVHALRATDDGGLLLGLHGALWRSDDDGLSWQAAGLDGQDAMSIGVAAQGAPLLIGGHDVLVRSTDGGQSFSPLRPSELPSYDIHALTQAISDPAIVYAFVVGAGIYRSDDAGDTWQATAAVGDTTPPDTSALVVSPDDPDVVLVASGSVGIFRSDDGAQSFTQVSDWGTLGLAIGGDPSIAVAATYRGVDISAGGSGTVWQNASDVDAFEGQPIAVTVDPAGTIWLVTEQPRVLLRSDDQGESWQEVARA